MKLMFLVAAFLLITCVSLCSCSRYELHVIPETSSHDSYFARLDTWTGEICSYHYTDSTKPAVGSKGNTLALRGDSLGGFLQGTREPRLQEK